MRDVSPADEGRRDQQPDATPSVRAGYRSPLCTLLPNHAHNSRSFRCSISFSAFASVDIIRFGFWKLVVLVVFMSKHTLGKKTEIVNTGLQETRDQIAKLSAALSIGPD